MISEEKNNHPSYPALKPVSDNNDKPSNACPSDTHVMGVITHILNRFKKCSTSWEPYLSPMSQNSVTSSNA